MQAKKLSIEDEHQIFDQLMIYGHPKQQRIMKTKYFIHGISGVGIQVVKNLLLIGPYQITLYDPTIVVQSDLPNNIYITKQSIGKLTRAQASLSQLKKLNPNTILDISTILQIQHIIQNYDCVIVIDCFNKPYLFQLNQKCRQKNVGFVYGGCLGLYGFVFVDFGEQFVTDDAYGQMPFQATIVGIQNSIDGIVRIEDRFYDQSKGHTFEDGDYVTFKDVIGMKQINGKQFRIRVIDKFSFTIGDTREYGKYTGGGGVAMQKLKSQTIKHQSLQESLKYFNSQNNLPFNFEQTNKPKQLHIILNALLEYGGEKQIKSETNKNNQTVRQIYKLCQKWMIDEQLTQGKENCKVLIDEKLIKNIIECFNVQITPLCLFWGGIIAQQAIKIIGKFAPLKQWFHYDLFQIRPEYTSIAQTNEHQSSYQKLFGNQFLIRISKMRPLIIGAGNIGTQVIKMLAQIGFSTQKDSSMYCVDSQRIKSWNLNLNQFYKKQHINRNKSQVLGKTISRVNQKCHLNFIQYEIGKQNQNKFTEQFWKSIDFVVCTASKNKTKNYIDSQCVWYEKPLFDIQVDGLKCNTHVILPYNTLTLNDLQQRSSKYINYDYSTIKNFPFHIEHIIQMATIYFEQNFVQLSENIKKYYDLKQKTLHQLRAEKSRNQFYLLKKLQVMKWFIELSNNKSFQKCVQKAFALFYQFFYLPIYNFLLSFPEKYVTQQTGKLFWECGKKRFPKLIKFDVMEELHIQFIRATANIYALMANIPQQNNLQTIKKLIEGIKYIKPVSKPHRFGGKLTPQEEAQVNKESQQNEKKIQQTLQFLSKYQATEQEKKQFKIIKMQLFQKNNWHGQFLYTATNLRAKNYQLTGTSKLKVLTYAGKIIPKTITTISTGVGALGMEVIKLMLKQSVSSHKNFSCNQSLPLYLFSEPLPAKKIVQQQFSPIMCGPVKPIPGQFTRWDKISIKGPLTVRELKQKIENDYNISVQMITYGASWFYATFTKKFQQKIQFDILDAIQKPQAYARSAIKLYVSGVTQEGVDVEMPDIRYFL